MDDVRADEQVPLGTLAERAWFAYQCGQRENGRLKPWRTLEQHFGLPESLLSSLFNGRRRSVTASTLERMSRALGVTADWLLAGRGEPPKLTGRYCHRRESVDALRQRRRIKVYLKRLGFEDDPIRKALLILLPGSSEEAPTAPEKG